MFIGNATILNLVAGIRIFGGGCTENVIVGNNSQDGISDTGTGTVLSGNAT